MAEVGRLRRRPPDDRRPAKIARAEIVGTTQASSALWSADLSRSSRPIPFELDDHRSAFLPMSRSSARSTSVRETDERSCFRALFMIVVAVDWHRHISARVLETSRTLHVLGRN